MFGYLREMFYLCTVGLIGIYVTLQVRTLIAVCKDNNNYDKHFS